MARELRQLCTLARANERLGFTAQAPERAATINRSYFARDISLSPDGKTLYVAADAPCTCGLQGQRSVIDVVDTATYSSVQQFVVPVAPDTADAIYNVLISPDNAKLYSNHGDRLLPKAK